MGMNYIVNMYFVLICRSFSIMTLVLSAFYKIEQNFGYTNYDVT